MPAICARDLSSRLEQAAASFQATIRCSIAADGDHANDDDNKGSPSTSVLPDLADTDWSSLHADANAPFSCPLEDGGHGGSKTVAYPRMFGEHPHENGDIYVVRRRQHLEVETGENLIETDENKSSQTGTDVDDTKARLSDATDKNTRQGAAVWKDTNSVYTIRAAVALSSDLCRLAQRQGDAACQLVAGKGSTNVAGDRYNQPCDIMTVEIPTKVARLGTSVRLQARAVVLMEEVVKRTAHSRVRRWERERRAGMGAGRFVNYTCCC